MSPEVLSLSSIIPIHIFQKKATLILLLIDFTNDILFKINIPRFITVKRSDTYEEPSISWIGNLVHNEVWKSS